MPEHDASIESVRPRDGRCQCECACHVSSHYRGCPAPTGDPRVDLEYRELACFECLVTCDG